MDEQGFSSRLRDCHPTASTCEVVDLHNAGRGSWLARAHTNRRFKLTSLIQLWEWGISGRKAQTSLPVDTAVRNEQSFSPDWKLDSNRD
jgi:hypothetical protein